ncbi:MAG TPA: competence protein ComEC family protein [Candidatus Borkfalkia excrementavium]|uniref:Competence protein ComEC family protein n=1 Tax=Candidatus Borkfalkia excrementavium TaxID=2838505 RepID=A0A9D1ZAW5_9FIRM|nr:competence protein ComEC family protein [Candidatus Borkfalkia excrementavium]
MRESVSGCRFFTEEKMTDFCERKNDHKLYKGDRIINFRPLFFFALALACGIALSFYFSLYALIAGGAVLAAGGAILFFFRRKLPLKRTAFLILALVLAICTGALTLHGVRRNYENAAPVQERCFITGRVCETSVGDYGWRLTLEDVNFLTAERSFDTDFCLSVYVYGEERYRTGMRVAFAADVTTEDFISYGRINVNAVIGGVKYRAAVSSENVEILEEKTEVFGAVRDRLYDVLFSSMEKSEASVAYAMLTGDSGFIDEGDLQNFRYGGVAHIFAVSGLHIGIIYGLLRLLFKKVRLHPIVSLVLTAGILVFYAGVCGFSPSSVRALTMCLILYASELAGVAYDKLNSVSAAAIVVLLINPVYLFSVGFQLSVAAAAGIIVVGGCLFRALSRVRFLPKKFSSAVSVALSAQIATFPILLDSFGYVSAVSLVLNLVFIPLISFVYSVLFVCSFLACVLPFAADVILFLPKILLALAVTPIVALDWKILLISGFSFGTAMLFWYLFFFFLSDKINLKPVPKCIGASAIAIAFAVCIAAENIFPGFPGYIQVSSVYGTDIVLLRASGKNYCVVTGELSLPYTERILMKEGIDSLDGVLLACDAKTANIVLPVLLKAADCERAYISSEAGLADSFHSVETTEVSRSVFLNPFAAAFVGTAGVLISGWGADILICAEGYGEMAEEDLPACDILIADAFNAEICERVSPSVEIYFDKTKDKINVTERGDLQIGVKNDIIAVKGNRFFHEVRIV